MAAMLHSLSLFERPSPHDPHVLIGACERSLDSLAEAALARADEDEVVRLDEQINELERQLVATPCALPAAAASNLRWLLRRMEIQLIDDTPAADLLRAALAGLHH